MPIYEYRCESCGFQDEFLQKLSDPLLTDCPKCGKPTFTKLLSAAGFQLKGSGWYVTDFRDKGAKKPASKDASKDAASSSTDKESKESKPAETKESPAETKKEQSVSGT